jgi:hypothetical protein
MLYLNSILFTMLRNYGIEKLQEALCTDMAEYPSLTHPLSQQTNFRRKGTAARPPIEVCDRGERPARFNRSNSARVSHRSGHSLPVAALSFSPIFFSRTAFRRPHQLSVAGHRALSSVLAGPCASLSPSARFSALSRWPTGLPTVSPARRVAREYVLTRGVATPP